MVLGDSNGRKTPFAYGAVTLYGVPFQDTSARSFLCNSLTEPQLGLLDPITPFAQRLRAFTCKWFRLFPFRSPLLRESNFSFFS